MRSSFTLIELLVCLMIIAVLLALVPEVFPFIGLLLLGWVGFLGRVVPRLNPDMTVVIAALVALLLFTLGVHWLSRKTTGTTWTCRRSIAATALVFILFGAGVAMVGLVHMSYWLATSPEPLRITRTGGSGYMYSQNNLKQMVVAAHNYHDSSMVLPVAGTFSDDGRALHGWETQLLPYLEETTLYRQIDKRYPWNDSLNAPHFKKEIKMFRHPRFFQETQDKDGFALIHYAANSHVVRAGEATKFGDISDGLGNTILMGEINSGFPSWARPMNVRDPGLGINRSPRGFGGPPGVGGANFAFADGHIMFIHDNVSPEVLRALATPAGGERVDPESLKR